MSCGNPHETDCRTVLETVYSYLDGEIDHEMRHRIAHHLTECAPCLSQFEIEELVKALVRRSCTATTCSGEIKERIMASIQAARTGAQTSTAEGLTS